VVEVGHETDRRDFVPVTRCGAPGDPFVTVTTTPSPLSALEPTASHNVAVGHEIEVSRSTPLTLWLETTWPPVDGDDVDVEVDEGEDVPHAERAAAAASANTSTTIDLRTTSPQWIAGSDRRRMEGEKPTDCEKRRRTPRGPNAPRGVYAAARGTP
jgi:hypothetical protein